HTDAELGVLLEKARHLLEDPAQEALDLGISPEPAVARIQHAAEQHGALLAAPAQSSTERDGAGRVQSTASMVLYDALACAYTSLGFEKLDDAVFRDLVIARIVEPTSKRDAARVLADLGGACQMVCVSRTERNGTIMTMTNEKQQHDDGPSGQDL